MSPYLNDVTIEKLKEVHDILLAIKLLLFYEANVNGEFYKMISDCYTSVLLLNDYILKNKKNG